MKKIAMILMLMVTTVWASPAKIHWMAGPLLLPQGSKFVSLEGDPNKPGPFTVRIKLPANYQIPPHILSNIEDITVISGEFYIGMGDTFDAGRGQLLPTSSFFLVNSNVHHYAWTEKETIIQLHGTGPWSMQYVNTQNDPKKRT